MNYKYLFGPVPSRRFGMSLGVDLVPFKTCTFDCIYCECGKTTDLTVERKEYIQADLIIAELDDFLKSHPALDFITLTGSGEPTLNLGIGKIVKHLKRYFGGYRVAILTNGTLLDDDCLIDDINMADVIKVTLNAADDNTLCRINQPHGSVGIDGIMSGIRKLRANFKNEIWIELFVIPGINDTDVVLSRLKEELSKINPDVIHLNSLDRPGSFAGAVPASGEILGKVKKFLEPMPVKIISKVADNVNNDNGKSGFETDPEEAIVSIIKRRPSTADDIVMISSLPKDRILKLIAGLKEKNIIGEKIMERGIFYFVR
jgi:wyosine [tRNA(Phe)-imidazoG37] synthetase (radical SAM superfamily)